MRCVLASSQDNRRPRSSIACAWLALFALLVSLASCSSTVERRDWSKYTGPGAEWFQREEYPLPRVEDRLEPVNRLSAFVTDRTLRYGVRPIAWAYRHVMPREVRERLTKAGQNVLYPVRLCGNLLQGKFSAAWEETERFAVNTTVGVLGLFDPATNLGLHPHKEDFGQAFAAWGWRESTYLYVPLSGPSTIRDGIGLVPDTYADPLSWHWPAPLARRFNDLSDTVDEVLRLTDSYYDAYEPARTLYALQRRVDVRNYEWKREESGATQTLDTVFLTFKSPKFPSRGRTDYVQLDGHEWPLPYTYFAQEHAAPLVYVVPGFGGHRLGNATLALAEMFHKAGNAVVAVSNPTNWEFMRHAASVTVPGYTPVDSLDLHRALTAIDRELEQLHPGAFRARQLAGVSMGAFQALHIAGREAEPERAGLLRFELFLALDPPVSLEHAALQLDRFYNTPLAFPAAEREARVEDLFGKVLYLSEGELLPGDPLPFTREESEFLIGLAFRIDMQQMLLQSQDLHDMGVLKTKRSRLRMAPAFAEASEYSFLEYLYGFALPYYAKRGIGVTLDEAGARKLFEECDLHAIADGLRGNERVLLFANLNDFLLRPEDPQFLRETLGSRANFFPAGGHLGNLHREAIQQIIRERVAAAP
ncbi:MAG: VacJ family lipoprotein [Planctomycetota bacterium]|nr:MAG: VacJ family lipoprotein [Planctomycetota bacterium]